MFVIYIPKLNCYLSKKSTSKCLICAENIESKQVIRFKKFDNAVKRAAQLAKYSRLDFEIVNIYDIN